MSEKSVSNSQPAGAASTPVAAPLPSSPVAATLNHGGQQIPFHFPDSGNIRAQLASIFAGTEYPQPPMQGYSPDAIIDIGANVGATALYFHLRYPGARLCCYEPSPTNFAYLKKNLGDKPRVDLFDYGLLDRDEEVKLFTGRHTSMQNSVAQSVETSGAFESTRVRQASKEFAERGLLNAADGKSAILKLDTEGCEVPILHDLDGAGMLETVDLLYLEYHSEEDRREIERLLSAANRFMLLAARAYIAHRGMNVYVARRLAPQFPSLDESRIDLART